MNDRHPSGTATPPAPGPDAAPAHYASYGGQDAHYGDVASYTDPSATTAFPADPLFGDLSGHGATGSYDTSAWATGTHPAPGADAPLPGTGTHEALPYDMYAAQHHAAFDTGTYDTSAWATDYQQFTGIPAQAGSCDGTGQWDARAWTEAGRSADGTQQWEWGTQGFDTGAYDATQWNSGGAAEPGEHDGHTAAATAATGTFAHAEPFGHAQSYDHTDTLGHAHSLGHAEAFGHAESFGHPETQVIDSAEGFDHGATAAFEQLPYERHPADDEPDHPGEPSTETTLLEGQEDIPPAPAPRAASRTAGRSRRRTPPRRSALLTIAVPSACVMGVAGIAAAATVGVGGSDGNETTASASDAVPVKPSTANNKLDSQLRGLSAGANDFADRASRTQERIDLKAQQAAEKKKAAAEAALKERMRPKLVLPVTQKGLSAYFGQAGVNWMSVHTGIDFPVSYGTTVMAATDGTVRTQWNSAYGNMLILTAKDGTETWYCHLSRYQVATGASVKAGEPIAFSGNSGNSTGPHLHFEVRPNGGAAVDPLPWLRSHGLDPT
ncbi:M23 family metallopeptidase [Streptomyces sp. NPDC096198]|uniref:M23 family metallopeptidase n=1 Tax=Streptomyces sp. NPDC096198 TaxID=3366080 RepID=UPI0038107A24